MAQVAQPPSPTSQTAFRHPPKKPLYTHLPIISSPKTAPSPWSQNSPRNTSRQTNQTSTPSSTPKTSTPPSSVPKKRKKPTSPWDPPSPSPQNGSPHPKPAAASGTESTSGNTHRTPPKKAQAISLPPLWKKISLGRTPSSKNIYLPSRRT